MANSFNCDVCGEYYKTHDADTKNVSVNIRVISNVEGKGFDFIKKDLCPKCYRKLMEFLYPEIENVENVQSEEDTECFEKEITMEEAIILLQQTWCYKCKGLDKDGMCRKSLPRSGRSCLDYLMSNEIPEAFEEINLEEMKNEIKN